MAIQTYFRMAHGIFMTISWGIFIVTGVLFARHFRGYQTTYCGVKMWFSMHRALNSIGLAGIVLGTICIVVAQGEWEGPGIPFTAMTAGSWHSLLGTTAILLAIIQPINALFRCKEGSRKRKRFTWAHRIIGFSSFAFAMATMLIATICFTGMFAHPITAMVIWIAYLVILIASVGIKQLITYREWKINRATPAGKIVFESDCAKTWKAAILAMFLVSAVVICILLCVLIITKPIFT